MKGMIYIIQINKKKTKDEGEIIKSGQESRYKQANDIACIVFPTPFHLIIYYNNKSLNKPFHLLLVFWHNSSLQTVFPLLENDIISHKGVSANPEHFSIIINKIGEYFFLNFENLSVKN